MKYQQLRSQLIKQTLFLLMLIGILGVIIGGLCFWSDIYHEDNQKLKNDVNAVTNDAAQLEDKFNKVQNNIGLYQEAMAKHDAGQLTINHQSVGDVFNALNDKFYLSSLHITMSPIEESKGPNDRRKNDVLVTSDISVTFQAVSDEHVYNMLDNMQRALSGSTRLTKLILKRRGDLNESTLQTIVQKGTYPLVDAEMRFLWFGIKPLDVKPAPDATKKN